MAIKVHVFFIILPKSYSNTNKLFTINELFMYIFYIDVVLFFKVFFMFLNYVCIMYLKLKCAMVFFLLERH